jgi:FKBP-type peptidyl-prolyl cis-trans isomerase SlyD
MKAQIVSFHCVLKDKLGRVLGTSANFDVLTYDPNQVAQLKGLTEGLQDIQSGEKRKIFVPAEDAYGFYDLKRVVQVPLEDFNQPPKLGQTIHVPDVATPYRVTEIKNEIVTLDGNHPLAGQDLIFEVEAIDARPALAEDLTGSDRSANNPLFH